MEDALEQVLEAWRTNNRIHLFLLDHISDEGMRCTLSKRGGRNVARQFAHLHNVRVWQLTQRAKDLAEGLHPFETADEPDQQTLKEHLAESAKRVEAFFEDCARGVPRRRNFKKGVVSALSYFVAHESHHRGNILLTLKQSGHNLDQSTRYAIWGMWNKV